ncbi:MAG: helicase-related protein, partial [Oscillospiraceae bacterium]
KEFQNDPELIAVDGGVKTAVNIEQSFYVVPQSGKNDAVKLLLEYNKPKRALIFVNTKKMADELSSSLNDAGFKSSALHGDLKQSQRTSVMQEFKAGRSRILIATDVAARGIDVDDIEAVINYDIPQDNEYYVHRIGRTGRAGKKGASFTLAANRTQIMRVRDIERFLKCTITEQAIPSLESIIEKQTVTHLEEIRTMVDENAGYEYKSFIEQLVAEGRDAVDIAAALYAKIANKNSRLAQVRNIKKAESFHGGTGKIVDGKVWLRVDIGSDDRIGPNFIVGAIVEATGLAASAVGKINIFNDYTDIEMKKADANEVLDVMKNAHIKQKSVTFTIGAETSDDAQARRKNMGGYRGGSRGSSGGSSGGYRGNSGGYRGKKTGDDTRKGNFSKRKSY